MSRSLREPSLLYPAALMYKLEYAPERREGHYTHKSGDDDALDQQRCCTEGKSAQGKEPPASESKIVFSLDDQGMEKAYYKKGGQTDQKSVKIHNYPVSPQRY